MDADTSVERMGMMQLREGENDRPELLRRRLPKVQSHETELCSYFLTLEATDSYVLVQS